MTRAPFDVASAVDRRLVRFTCVAALLAIAACNDQPAPLAPTTSNRPSDASALRIPSTATYTDLTARGEVTCAVRSDGVVQCWGSSIWGAAPASRTAITGSFLRLSTSGDHTCATRSDGAVECWGRAQDDEAPSLKLPPSGRSFTSVSAGQGYTCALRDDGVVQCWGYEDPQVPAEWSGTSGSFTAVSAGGPHTCGLTTAGVIECIGGTPFTLTPASGTFTKVMVGSVASCGIRTDGVVQCYGSVPSGFVFPEGTFIDYDVYYASPSVIGAYTCGVRPDGTVACFGDNAQDRAPATRTAATGSFTRVVLGQYHGCALRTDGHIECWGNPNAAVVDHVLPTATFTAPTSVIVGQDITLSLSGAQVPGYPSVTDFTYAFACAGVFGSPSAVATVNCATTTTGSRTVSGRVIDPDQDGTTYTATVIVKSAAEGTTDLGTEISTAGLSPDIRKALLAKLNAALKAIADGKTKSACSALSDFINQVKAQRGKAILAATADAWIQTAQELQAALGC